MIRDDFSRLVIKSLPAQVRQATHTVNFAGPSTLETRQLRRTVNFMAPAHIFKLVTTHIEVSFQIPFAGLLGDIVF
jgi:hypothetical protein